MGNESKVAHRGTSTPSLQKLSIKEYLGDCPLPVSQQSHGTIELTTIIRRLV
jgi:hypothetical protein